MPKIIVETTIDLCKELQDSATHENAKFHRCWGETDRFPGDTIRVFIQVLTTLPDEVGEASEKL